MNKTNGNMYEWVDKMWCPLQGQCPHQCSYCCVEHTPAGRMGVYSGPPRLSKRQMGLNLGSGKTVFVCHLGDLFADGISSFFIAEVIRRTQEFPDNTYVWQTKNPQRYHDFRIRRNCALGTTIESDIWFPKIMGLAPHPLERMNAMLDAKQRSYRTFVTVEPILEFTEQLALDLVALHPDWVNVGADSKRHNLPEPSGDKVRGLVVTLREAGIEVREKPNLARITGKGTTTCLTP